jgi:hypothetical protein
MFTALYVMSDAVIILGSASVIAVLSILVVRIVSPVLPEPGKDTMDLVTRTLGMTGGILTFILAFTIVQATSELGRVAETINNEARMISVVDRALLHFDAEATAPTRELLTRYAVSILKDEWPEMLKRSYSQQTAALISQVSRSINELMPTSSRQEIIFAELLRDGQMLELKRGERLLHAESTRVSGAFWLVIAVLLGATMLLTAFSEPSAVSILMIAMFGLLIGFLIVLDEPFFGSSGVRPEPFRRMLTMLSSTPTIGADDLRTIGVTSMSLKY